MTIRELLLSALALLSGAVAFLSVRNSKLKAKNKASEEELQNAAKNIEKIKNVQKELKKIEQEPEPEKKVLPEASDGDSITDRLNRL